MAKGCIKCGLLITDNYNVSVCPTCKEDMRVVFHQDFNDILVKNLPSEKDSPFHYGHHLGCGGYVEKHEDSRGGKVYVCIRCYLRIRERDLNTIALLDHPEEYRMRTNQEGLMAYERSNHH